MNHRRSRSKSLLIQMKTMKNLEMILEPLQTLKPTVPVLPENSGDEDSEYGDEKRAQSRDSEKNLVLSRSLRSD